MITGGPRRKRINSLYFWLREALDVNVSSLDFITGGPGRKCINSLGLITGGPRRKCINSLGLDRILSEGNTHCRLIMWVRLLFEKECIHGMRLNILINMKLSVCICVCHRVVLMFYDILSHSNIMEYCLYIDSLNYAVT